MADQGRSELLCSFYHESLRTWIKTIVNKFAISNHTTLLLGVRALRGCLNQICEYELHSLPSKKVSGAKDHGKNYIKVRPPLVSHLLHNRLSYSKQWNHTANRYFRCGSKFVEKVLKIASKFERRFWRPDCFEFNENKLRGKLRSKKSLAEMKEREKCKKIIHHWP